MNSTSPLVGAGAAVGSAAVASAPALTDEERETLINAWYHIALTARSRPEQRHAFERMREHISQRSPQQIASMERDKRLSRT
jgi:hypothetical protein